MESALLTIHQTRVGVSHLGSYYADYNFSNPHEFIPERFIDKKDPAFANDDFAAYQPWSIGVRNCIGRNLAYAELRLTLAKLLWSFDITLDEGKTGDFLDQKIWSIWAKRELFVNIKARID